MLMIRVLDCGLGFEDCNLGLRIEIVDYDWGLGIGDWELGIWTCYRDWELESGIGITDWDC